MSDPYDLDRFIQAQDGAHERALSEIVAGRKRTHWMWFIFPQFAGLSSSQMSRRYAIQSVNEARAYLEHPLLGARLMAIAEAVVAVEGRSAAEIFGSPDDRKLQSSATLFASRLPPGSVFDRLLAKYYAGRRDESTLSLIESERASA